jgi:TP901 family phage tail tape measure protein
MSVSLTIPTTFTAIDRFTAVLKGMQGRLTSFTNVAMQANQRFIGSMQNISTRARSIAGYTAIAGAAILAPFIHSARDAVAFEHTMAKVNTIAGLNAKQMVAMNRGVLDITRKVPVAYEDVAEGLYIINSAGIKGAKGLDAINNSAKLSVAGLGSVKEAAHLLSSVIVVFGGEGDTAAQIYNKLALVVRNGKTTIAQMSEGFGKAAISVQLAGVKLNEFLSMTGALTVKGSSAAEAYNQIQGAAQALLKPNETMIRAFRSLGVHGSFAGQELIKRFGGLVPTMEAINHALDKMGLRRAKAYGRIGAFIAQAALTPGGKAYGHFTENMADMKNQPNAGDTMFQTMLGTTSSQFTLLKNNLKAFSIEVGLHLLPTLTKVSQKLSPIIDRVINWMDKNPGLTDTIIKITAGLGAFLFVVSPLAMTVSLVADAFAGFGVILTAFGISLEATPIGWIITGIVALIAVVTAVIAKWDDWGAAVSLFLGPLGLVISLIQSFRRNWDGITTSFKTGGLIEGFKTVGKVLMDAILYPLQQMLDIIGKLTHWQWATNAAHGLAGLRTSMGMVLNNSIAPAPPKPTLAQAPVFVSQMQSQASAAAAPSRVDVYLHDPGGVVKSTKVSGGIGINKPMTTHGRKGAEPVRANVISTAIQDFIKNM